MAARYPDDLTLPDTSRPATIAPAVRPEVDQSVSDRRFEFDPTSIQTQSDSRIASNVVPATTPLMTDEDVRRTFCSVERDLERLRTAHITH